MANQDYILAPSSVKVSFVLEPVKSIMHSMMLLNLAEVNSGLANWVTDTAAALSPERKVINQLVLGTCYDGLVHRIASDDFPEFLENLAGMDPVELRGTSIEWMRENEHWPADDAALTDVDLFMQFIETIHAGKAEKGHELDPDYWRAIHPLLGDPPALKNVIVEHLNIMWNDNLQAEWARVQPMLEESIAAFRQVDFSGLSAFEIVQFVTGRDLRGIEHFVEAMENVKRLEFSPSPHLGPYLSWHETEEAGEFQFIYGARLPKGATVSSPSLSRSELLVRLSALADDTRLQILELLTRHEELCAQDFITMLDLSQSSASRHLRQLSATGFLTERRRDVSKCYSLNPDRVEDTMNAVRLFLQSL